MVQCSKGASAITAHGQTSERDYGKNRTKVTLSDNVMLQLQFQLAGPSKKKLPAGQRPTQRQLGPRAVCYLLRCGEYLQKNSN